MVKRPGRGIEIRDTRHEPAGGGTGITTPEAPTRIRIPGGPMILQPVLFLYNILPHHIDTLT
jgi:hypothetical protein